MPKIKEKQNEEKDPPSCRQDHGGSRAKPPGQRSQPDRTAAPSRSTCQLERSAGRELGFCAWQLVQPARGQLVQPAGGQLL